MKNLFRPIAELLKPPPKQQRAEVFEPLEYGISAAAWERLKTLPSEPGWKEFVLALDHIVNLRGEQILQTSNVDAIHFARGVVWGLRKAATLVDEITLKEGHFAREQQRPGSKQRAGANSAFYGSPGWRTQRTSRDG